MSPGDYNGPEGYGASPETGGTVATGRNRIQSLEPMRERLTKERKEEILALFSWFVDVVRIDKTRKGYVRIWYNGSLHVPYPD
jgi:hypothetical protein